MQLKCKQLVNGKEKRTQEILKKYRDQRIYKKWTEKVQKNRKINQTTTNEIRLSRDILGLRVRGIRIDKNWIGKGDI